MKKYIPIFLIVCIAALLRYIYIDAVPNAVGGDELHYVNTAKSIWLTGSDSSGAWNPWSLLLFQYPPNEHQAELPYVLHLLFSAPFPNSLLLVKLPFVLLGIGVVILLYLISGVLLGPTFSVVTGIIAAINPWLIVMSRTGYEAMPATFFYLLSFYVLLKIKGWKILLTSLPLLFAFYSYIATKVIFVPFVILSCIAAYKYHKNQFKLQYIVLSSFSVFVVILFFLLIHTGALSSRLNDIYFINSPTIAENVNVLRKTTITFPFTSLVINKFTVYTETTISKVFRIFSPTYHFFDGDQFFLPVQHGFFYYSDFIFLIIGLSYLYKLNKKLFLLLCALLVLGALPHLLNTTISDFSIHLTMMFPFMILFIGIGIQWVISHAGKKGFYQIVLGIIILYMLQVTNFTQAYFGQYALIGHGDFPIRLLSKYITLAELENQKVYIFSNTPQDDLQKHMFYSDTMYKNNKNIQFVPCGMTDYTAQGYTVIYDTKCGLPKSDHHQSITRLSDGGENYIIENDRVCYEYDLTYYATGISLDDFNVERLSQKKFCETFISRR